MSDIVRAFKEVTDTIRELARRVRRLESAPTGDMIKAVYDTNDNGIVDAAEAAPWTGITGTPSAFPVTVRKNSGVDVGSQDRLNLVEGANVTLTVADDAIDGEIDITIAAAAGSGTIVVRKNSGADVGTRPRLNFIEGSNITLTVADDAVDSEVDITIASSQTIVGQSLFTIEGDLSIVSNPLRIYNKFGVTKTISQVFLSVDTAPTGAAIIVDVNKNGVTIFTNPANRPQIAATANTGNTTTIDIASWVDGDYLTMDVDAIGSTIPGANLTVHIIYS